MEMLITERDNIDPCPHKKMQLNFTYNRFIEWAKQLVVVGFNSRKYDLNLIKKYLIKRLQPDGFNVVKRGNVFMLISAPYFRFKKFVKINFSVFLNMTFTHLIT